MAQRYYLNFTSAVSIRNEQSKH